MSLAFSDYLDAKFELDERSFNADVRGALILRLGAKASLNCLDVGMGTGAGLPRLLNDCTASLTITGLDIRAELVESARQNFAQCLHELNFHPRQRQAYKIDGRRGERVVTADFLCTSLQAFDPPLPIAYDLITAHAFMDLVPLAPAIDCFARWLAPGGLFYATLNYDGGTTLFPAYADGRFESELLAVYDASMDSRRVDGAATGGSRCGLRMHTALQAAGFDIIAYGSSDWNLTPLHGAYRNRDAVCLRALLDLLGGEGERSAGIDARALAAWRDSRLRQLEANSLGLIIHQVDILAASPEPRARPLSRPS